MDIKLPPDSISINTLEIIKACELAEIYGVTSSSSSSFILVTQLASFLYLRQYNHARHLWRRYKSECIQYSSSSTTTTNNNDHNNTMNDIVDVHNDIHQFQRLWNAIEPLLQVYYGHRTTHDNHHSSKNHHKTLLEQYQRKVQYVYDALQSCVDDNVYPLSMYALELKNRIRDQMAELIENVYDLIQVETCHLLLLGSNRNSGSSSNEKDLDEYLVQRSWEKKKSNQEENSMGDDLNYWIPATHNNTTDLKFTLNEKERTKNNNNLINGNAKIEFLSNVVGFMEKKNKE